MRPHDADERKLLWDFRLNDVSAMVTYYTLIDAVCFGVLPMMYINDTAQFNNYHIFIEFVAFLLHVIVIVMRNRQRKALMGMLLSLFAVSSLLHVIELW